MYNKCKLLALPSPNEYAMTFLAIKFWVFAPDFLSKSSRSILKKVNYRTAQRYSLREYEFIKGQLIYILINMYLVVLEKEKNT